MKNYLKFANRKSSPLQQILVLVAAGVVLLGLLPYLVLCWATALDQRFNLPRLELGALNPILAVLLVILGIGLAWWSIYAQLTIGQGTPVPLAPTQKLVVVPPFTYCRNPMTLGTLIASLALPAWTGSLSALALVLIFFGLLLTYIKLLEEKELAARFGEAYLDYKRRTPFMLPRLRSKR